MINLIAMGVLEPKTLKELSESFEAVRKHYELAEQKLKLIEMIDSTLYIPSVNELRYAGCHLSRASGANDSETVKSELDKALRHCKRAIYDALEIGITFYLEDLRKFNDDYRLVVITTVIPDLTAIKIRITKIKDFITKPRTEERELFWEDCTRYFNEIQEISATLEHSRDELNKIVEQQKKAKAGHLHKTILSYIAIAVTIIGIGYKLYSDAHPVNAASSTNSNKSLIQDVPSVQKISPKETATGSMQAPQSTFVNSSQN